MPRLEAQAVPLRVGQDAASAMRSYDTARRALAHLSVHYAVVTLGYSFSPHPWRGSLSHREQPSYHNACSAHIPIPMLPRML